MRELLHEKKLIEDLRFETVLFLL